MRNSLGPRGVRPNGLKIKALRKRAGFSQRDFAARFALTMRTLQRAETGDPIGPAMLNSIAAGLKVASSELCLDPSDMFGGTTPVEPHKEQVRLPKTATARAIFAALASVQRLTYDYDIDPDEETAEELAAAIEIIEQLEGKAADNLAPSTYVRQLGRLNSLLKRLEGRGVRFFIGSYWEPTVIIQDEPAPAPSTQYCRVETICQGIMLICHAKARYLTRSVIRKYTDQQIDASIQELKNNGWEVEDRRITS